MEGDTMKRSMQVFVIPKEPGPAAMPRPDVPREVEAETIDGLRAAGRAALESDGHRVRAVSFTRDGLVAYVEALA